AARPGPAARFGPIAPASALGGVPLRLAYRGDLAATELFDYLQDRIITGIEEMTGDRGTRTYRRTLRLPYGTGIAEVEERTGNGWLECRLHLTELRDLTTAAQRIRRLFDLDADPYAVAARLGSDPALGPLVARTPGLRAPGAADPHEMAVRAVLGQQVTVAAGRGLGSALVASRGQALDPPSGGLTHVFPTVAALADGSLEALRMPGSRRETLRTLSAALADGTVVLDPGADRDDTEQALLSLKGIGPWTAGYIRMRALGDPDVLLTGDVALGHALRRTGADDPEPWRPWRSYAMHHLWHSLGARALTGPR
ncbi:MAG: AlkA N-terminal domain-containing protein, partial [Streptosporangiaceae bacterium]